MQNKNILSKGKKGIFKTQCKINLAFQSPKPPNFKVVMHHFIQVCAESRVAHLTRATGRQESEHLLGLIVGQYRRLLSVTAVRAHAMCLLARVGLITPTAKEAAARRVVAMRMEEEVRRD